MNEVACPETKAALDRLNAAMLGDPRPLVRDVVRSFEAFPLTEKAKLMRRLANRCKASERTKSK